MQRLYVCADCGQEFPIELSQEECETCLAAERSDRCPGCGQTVGHSTIKCQHCGQPFVVTVPHRHVRCDLVPATVARIARVTIPKSALAKPTHSGRGFPSHARRASLPNQPCAAWHFWPPCIFARGTRQAMAYFRGKVSERWQPPQRCETMSLVE